VEVTVQGATFSFVLVPALEGYAVGLTEARRLDPLFLQRGFSATSAVSGGPVRVDLLHPFFLQRTEATNAQLWAWIRAAKVPAEQRPRSLRSVGDPELLPVEVAVRPATGVTYATAREFAAWVDRHVRAAAPAWRVRLPHELEWEIAGRGDTRSHACERGREEALTASVAAAAPGAPIGANPLDRSWVGAVDMTGGACEWTLALFDPELLERLRVRLAAGTLDGWDPRRTPSDAGLVRLPPAPARGASAAVTVRGGTNGDSAHFLDVSLRRRQEWSSDDPCLGFRLLLVRD
jgi:formylglycine-generating enzyme required for sulfatase activity